MAAGDRKNFAGAAMMQVWAAEEVREENFPNAGNVHLHAIRGDLGDVVGVTPEGWINVTWRRTGSTTVCHPCEISPTAPGPVDDGE